MNIYIYVNILRKWHSWREEGIVCVIHSRSANKTIVVGLWSMTYVKKMDQQT